MSNSRPHRRAAARRRVRQVNQVKGKPGPSAAPAVRDAEPVAMADAAVEAAADESSTSALEPSEWQRLLLEDLDAVAEEYPEVVIDGAPHWRDGLCVVAISVDTTGFPRSPKARIRLHDRERFHITLRRDERRPPAVWVDHERFLGGAHVMSGYHVCLYLDESREWDPGDGIRGPLGRLWSWLADTAGNKFNGPAQTPTGQAHSPATDGCGQRRHTAARSCST